MARLRAVFDDDTDGKPWNAPLLPRPVVITLDRDLVRAATWINAALPAEFQLGAGRRYWMTVQCVDGEAGWSADAATETPSTGPMIPAIANTLAK